MHRASAKEALSDCWQTDIFKTKMSVFLWFFRFWNRILKKFMKMFMKRKRYKKMLSSFSLPFHRYDHNNLYFCFSIRRSSWDCEQKRWSQPDDCSSWDLEVLYILSSDSPCNPRSLFRSSLFLRDRSSSNRLCAFFVRTLQDRSSIYGRPGTSDDSLKKCT